MDTQIIIKSISKLCNNNNISINQMLKNCVLSKSVIDNLKRGSMPSVDKLKIIADYFSVSVDYLLGNEDKKNTPSNSDVELEERIRRLCENSDNEELKKLLDVLPQLSPGRQKIISETADAYLLQEKQEQEKEEKK